jgi:hypothetical protein
VRSGEERKKKEREKEKERERERGREGEREDSGRAAHIKRELNVEISVSPQRARDDGGGLARRFLLLLFL